MGKINWRKVFFGGFLAGLVLNVLAIAAWALFLGREWFAAFEALGRPLQKTTQVEISWILLNFLSGVLVIWLYTAIRPRYGPGPKTAVGAAFGFWLKSHQQPSRRDLNR